MNECQLAAGHQNLALILRHQMIQISLGICLILCIIQLVYCQDDIKVINDNVLKLIGPYDASSTRGDESTRLILKCNIEHFLTYLMCYIMKLSYFVYNLSL